jgi:hypothetical protein
MQTAPLPWTIEADGPTSLIRDANGHIVAEVIGRDTAEAIVEAVTAHRTAHHTVPPKVSAGMV